MWNYIKSSIRAFLMTATWPAWPMHQYYGYNSLKMLNFFVYFQKIGWSSLNLENYDASHFETFWWYAYRLHWHTMYRFLWLRLPGRWPAAAARAPQSLKQSRPELRRIQKGENKTRPGMRYIELIVFRIFLLTNGNFYFKAPIRAWKCNFPSL